MDATTVAVDLAKSVFQLAEADDQWRVRNAPAPCKTDSAFYPTGEETDRPVMATGATPKQLDADNSPGVDITPLVSIGAAAFHADSVLARAQAAPSRCRIYDWALPFACGSLAFLEALAGCRGVDGRQNVLAIAAFGLESDAISFAQVRNKARIENSIGHSRKRDLRARDEL